MNALFGFLGSTTGRIIRALAGVALIVVGLLLIKGVGGVDRGHYRPGATGGRRV